MRKKVNKKRILLLLSSALMLFVLIAGIFSFPGTGSGRIHPQNGVLDLQGWEPTRDRPLSLSGQWKFYWDRLLNRQEIRNTGPSADIMVEIPSVWNSYKINGRSLPGFGFGTYMLKVINAPAGKPLALRMPTFSTAYELYIDDRLASSSGKVSRYKEQFSPGCKPQTVEFTPAEASFDIIVHVANFTYDQGGMCYVIDMGTQDQIRSMVKTRADKDLFLFGALIVMAFYYMNIFLLRHEDKSSLYFVFMCLLLASMTAISGDFLICRLVPFISFETIIAVYYIIMC